MIKKDIVLGALAMLSVLGCTPRDKETRYKFQGVAVSPVVSAPPLKLVRHDGSVFDLQAQKGKPAVIFFGYTNCPDYCPMTLSDWRKIKQALGTKSDSVNFILVTVDPERDTPAIIDAYAKKFDQSFIGLSGEPAVIAQIAKSYGALSFAASEPDHKGHYEISHPNHQYVIDGAGKLRFAYPFGFKPADIAEDIKHL